ncbi:AsmA family protein [Pseudomonas sp. PS1]|uniref:AsmA family protein n=1 Tax=Stutzerimonas marianensis TaxID=2929513 RepID=A0A9X2AUG7_9GAMM|nr:AsmA family protein [Pseudomonas marianensis]
MAKAAKILGIVLAVLLLFLAGAAMLIQTQWARNQLEDQLSQRLDGRSVDIGSLDIDWGSPLVIRASDIKIANPEWAEQPHLLELDALKAELAVGELLTGNPGLQLVALDKPQVHLSRRADGQSNWSALMSETDSQDKQPSLQPDTIQIDNGKLTYRDEALNVDLAFDISTRDDGAEGALAVDGSGQVQGKPLELTLTGAPPAKALAKDRSYAVTLNGRLGDIRARFEGEAEQVPQLDGLNGELSLSAPDSAELISFDNPALDVPGFELTATLRRDRQRWALDDIELRTGDDRLRGSIAAELGESPALDLQLHGDQLDLNRWGVMRLLEAERSGTATRETNETFEQQAHDLFQPLRRYRGEVDISLDRLRYGDTSLSDLALRGSLDGQQLELEQLRATQANGAISASGTLDLGSDSLSGELDLKLDRFDLGQALGPLGYPRLGTLDGELHAQLADAATRLSDTQLRYDAPAQDLRIELDAESTDSGLHLTGDAWRNQVPLQFELNPGSLQSLFQEETFSVEGTLRSGESQLTLDGHIRDPMQFKAAEARVSLEGPDLARLDPLTGLNLPSLGRYSLSGQLSWEDRQLRLQSLDGRWGESDVSGDVRLSLVGRPMLWANLHSNTLRLRDLKSPDTPDDSSGEQFFSSEPLGLDALRGRDAIIRYEAEEVIARDVPLNAVAMKAELDDGVLVIEPLQLAIGQGAAEGRLSIDARPERPTGELRLSLNGVNLTPVLKHADLSQVAQDSAGTLGGKLDVAFAGSSLGAMMADLRGKFELAMSGGRLDWLAVELLGLDAGQSVVAALADTDQVEMNCAYLRLDANQGIATLTHFFVNTTDSNITGGGEIGLGTEALDLAFETHAKDFSLLSGNAPVQLKGTLSNPQVSVVTDQLVAKTVASVVGAVVAPPLAILPWVELGLGEGSGMGCRKALKEFERN